MVSQNHPRMEMSGLDSKLHIFEICDMIVIRFLENAFHLHYKGNFPKNSSYTLLLFFALTLREIFLVPLFKIFCKIRKTLIFIQENLANSLLCKSSLLYKTTGE